MFNAIVNRRALASALAIVGKVCASRSPKPVLQCVLLELTGDALRVAASDLEVCAIADVDKVQVFSAGAVAVPADKLADIIRAAVGDTVTIAAGYVSEDPKRPADAAPDQITITDGGYSKDSWTIYAQPAADFPPVPAACAGSTAVVTAKEFQSAYKRTAFAAAKESTRYAFNGALLDFNGTLRVVATDGRRLAVVDTAAARTGPDIKAISPTKALKLAADVAKLLKTADMTVTIEPATDGKPDEERINRARDVVRNGPRSKYTAEFPSIGAAEAAITEEQGKGQEGLIQFAAGNVRIVSRKIEGQFPPYADVIPKGTDKAATLATAEFEKAIKRAGLMTTEESKGVRFDCAAGKGLTITAASPEAGRSTINLPCSYTGGGISIGFNPKFLADALKVVGTDDVTVRFSNYNRPLLLEAAGGFQYVLMPVNLTSYTDTAAFSDGDIVEVIASGARAKIIAKVSTSDIADDDGRRGGVYKVEVKGEADERTIDESELRDIWQFAIGARVKVRDILTIGEVTAQARDGSKRREKRYSVNFAGEDCQYNGDYTAADITAEYTTAAAADADAESVANWQQKNAQTIAKSQITASEDTESAEAATDATSPETTDEPQAAAETTATAPAEVADTLEVCRPIDAGKSYAEQAEAIGAEYPARVVMLKAGDFFQSFCTSAEIIAQTAGARLHDCGRGAVMCCVPYHQLYATAGKLTAAGYPVLIVNSPIGVQQAAAIATSGGNRSENAEPAENTASDTSDGLKVAPVATGKPVFDGAAEPTRDSEPKTAVDQNPTQTAAPVVTVIGPGRLRINPPAATVPAAVIVSTKRRGEPAGGDNAAPEFNPANALKLVADDVERLRAVDVPRLAEDCGPENWPKMRKWLLEYTTGGIANRELLSSRAITAIEQASGMSADDIDAARKWLSECTWADTTAEDIAEMVPARIERAVETHYEGGLQEFIRAGELVHVQQS